MLVVGIDVGGTQVKFGLVENGNIIRNMELGTNTFDIIRQLCNGARELVQSSDRTWEDVDGVAIGFPGMVINSVVMDSPNVNLQNCNLKEILEKELGKYVTVKNDAEMATLAEHKLGAGADCENMIMVTLGTGVGGGIIIDRKLYVGTGGAGELGHIQFERNGRVCGCGRRGCAEQYVSMIALDKLAKDIMVNYPNTCVDFNGDGVIFASEVMRAYKKNDACAIEIADKFVEDLTQYLLDLCNMFRPNRIVIGGGITHAPELVDMVARNCRRLEYGYKNSPKVDILVAQLGNQAGILGGYVCLEEELNRSVVDEEYINQIEEEINNDSQNISLLDSIALRLDKPVAETYGENLNEDEQEANGLYVNKFLDDISSEINTIKNEQLFESVNEETERDNLKIDDFNNIFEPVNVDSQDVGLNNSGFMRNSYQMENSNVNQNASAESEPVVEDNSSEQSSNEYESDANDAQGAITVDTLLESLKSSTENLNSAMNRVVNVGTTNKPTNNELEESGVLRTATQSDASVGIGDIFFGASASESESEEVEEVDSNEAVEYYDEQYVADMQGAEVVYDDNLLGRVNAMLNKKNQE